MKPRIDREVLARHSEGLIVTSACLAGEVAQHLMEDRWDAAREAAAWHAELFDGRYYLEVQGHDSDGQALSASRRMRSCLSDSVMGSGER
jgi:DNA polymerase III subunit alpha